MAHHKTFAFAAYSVAVADLNSDAPERTNRQPNQRTAWIITSLSLSLLLLFHRLLVALPHFTALCSARSYPLYLFLSLTCQGLSYIRDKLYHIHLKLNKLFCPRTFGPCPALKSSIIKKERNSISTHLASGSIIAIPSNPSFSTCRSGVTQILLKSEPRRCQSGKGRGHVSISIT